jgi:hypothetical protein
MAIDAGDEHCRAAGYHESAHIVIACDQGLPISPKGIYIDNFAQGRAWFRGATDGVAVPAADVDKVVTALFAGGIAHRRILQEIKGACAGDDGRIKQLLEAHNPDSKIRNEKHEQLLARAEETVDQQWGVISRVAEALWSKPWRPKNPHQQWPKEKALSASELVLIVAPVVPVIDESAD